MSRETQWDRILQEFTAQEIPFCIDTSGDPEPWLSYDAIARMWGMTKATIENKAAGIRRHPFLPMIKQSELERKLTGNVPNTPKKAKRKR